MAPELRCVTRKFHNSRRGNSGLHKCMKSREGRISRKKAEHEREEQGELHPKHKGWEKWLLEEDAQK